MGVILLCIFFNMGVFYHPGGDSLTIALTKFVICLFVYKPGTPMKKILKKIFVATFAMVSVAPLLCLPPSTVF